MTWSVDCCRGSARETGGSDQTPSPSRKAACNGAGGTPQDDRDAAVLYVHRRHTGECDLPGAEYEDETEHLVREDEGGWVSMGSGGGSWVNVFDPPADLLDKYVVLETGISGRGDGDGAIYFTGGLCSDAVAAVQTDDVEGTRTYPIDRERPFFVVGVRRSGRARILDRQGRVVRGVRGELLEFLVGD